MAVICRTHRPAVTGVLAAALLVAACNATVDITSGTGSGTFGGGGYGGTTNASATGVWSGTDSTTGLGVTALINSAGQATFIRSDGVQFVGSVQVSGSTLAVTVDGYTDYSSTFSDGSNFGIGTLNGTVTTGATLTASLAFTTHGGTAMGGNWSLTFEPLSNDASSTAAISGNYTDHVTGAVLSIAGDGVMTSQNAANGCVLNGSLATQDSTHDLYEVAFTYGNCTGVDAALNGVQFTGLATLNPGFTPAQITMAVTGASSASKYAIVSAYVGT